MKEVISYASKYGLLVSPDILDLNIDWDNFFKYILNKKDKPTLISKKEIEDFLKNKEKVVILKTNEYKIKRSDIQTKIEVLSNNNIETRYNKIKVEDFVNYYNKRYNYLKRILYSREELSDAISISNLRNYSKEVTVIAMVKNIRKTDSGNFIIDLEDPTGEITVLVSKNNEKLIDLCYSIVPDEVIGVKGKKSNRWIYVDDIIFPNIPVNGKTFPVVEDDVNIAFTSDIHIGSKMFLEKELDKFISWLNLEYGDSKQKEIASKVKYLFIVGDLVDGVGIYPEQEKELQVVDIYKQYELFENFIKKIPEDIELIILPGNHDAVPIIEPQPPISKQFLPNISSFKNISLLPNPSLVKVHDSYDILAYHGYSYDYYISNVVKLRELGGYDAPEKVMEFLLTKRHLSPTHNANPFLPDVEDKLLIKKIPHVFVSGHVHLSAVGRYRNVINIVSSCWQGRTSFQERVGHHPVPGRVPVLNLKNKKLQIMNFM